MSTNVYERVLQLMEAEDINTLFGIPDPSFFHMFVTAEKRGWQVIAPHHEEAGAFTGFIQGGVSANTSSMYEQQGAHIAYIIQQAS